MRQSPGYLFIGFRAYSFYRSRAAKSTGRVSAFCTPSVGLAYRFGGILAPQNLQVTVSLRWLEGTICFLLHSGHFLFRFRSIDVTVVKITLIGPSLLLVQKELCKTGKLVRFGKSDQQIPGADHRAGLWVGHHLLPPPDGEQRNPVLFPDLKLGDGFSCNRRTVAHPKRRDVHIRNLALQV
jgi:hypothetical protein